MFLDARSRGALRAAAMVLVAKAVVAAEPAPTTVECIAASESGQELRQSGKLREARAQFAVCAVASCPGPIREDCAQHLGELGKAIPSIVFVMMDPHGNAASGVTITAEGEVVAGAGSSAGSAIELDPGEHAFTFDAAGLKRVERRFVLAQGMRQRREVIIMDRAEADPVAGATPASPVDGAGRSPRRPPTLAWVAFGIGGAGLVLGVTAGLVAGAKHSSLKDVCGGETCAPRYADDLDAFHTWRTLSTAGYLVGALGVAGGATVWLTAPNPTNTTAHVWLGPTSAGVAGRF